jgi:membrane dipeptidase
MGIEHVGLGSDFDGATMPAAIGDVAGLPRLLDALAEGGFDAGEIERLAWANWRRVLALAWGS